MIGARLWGFQGAAAQTIDVRSLLKEMVDFENLAERPEPFFKEAMASSYSRESHKGGDAWFDNDDVGQYVRTETNDGRKEHVLADLKGPGTITRFWSANPMKENITRFYFDGETQPRLAVPLAELFTGRTAPFGPDFSYISGTGGNLYYPLPYATSLKITIEEKANANEPVKEERDRRRSGSITRSAIARTRRARGRDVRSAESGSLGRGAGAVGRALYRPAPASGAGRLRMDQPAG